MASAPKTLTHTLRSTRSLSSASSIPTRLPPPPPSRARTLLPSRAFLALHGDDAPKFLQGLVTVNITPSIPAQPQALYAAFLNARGRLLNDVFIYPLSAASPLLAAADVGVPASTPPDSPVFLIEAHADEVQSLAARLKKHKLRAKVGIRVLLEGALEAHAAWADHDSPAATAEALTGLAPPLERPYAAPLFVARDRRTVTLGVRALRPAAASADTGSSAAWTALPTADPQHYTIRRYERGVAEGPAELARETMLPHAAGLELLGAVDLRKGCYIGQELVTRTQHRGVVRRRVVGCQLWDSARGTMPRSIEYEGRQEWAVPGGADVQRVDRQGEQEGVPQEADGVAGAARKTPRSAGKWIAGIGEVGLAEVVVEQVLGLPPGGDLKLASERAREGWGLRWDGQEEDAPMMAAFIPEAWRERKELFARNA